MNLKKKVEILGLEVPVLAIIAILAVPLAAGATLTYYGAIEGTAEVEQSVLLNDNVCDSSMDDCTVPGEYGGALIAGDTVTEIHTLTTKANVPAEVSFDTTPDEEEGITTSYQRVTTTMAKDQGSVAWVDHDDDGKTDEVELTSNTSQLTGDEEATANVMVPVNEEVPDSDSIASNFFTAVIDSTEDKASGQLMIDLDPNDRDSYWAQVSGTEDDYTLFIYESEGDYVDLDEDSDAVGLTGQDAGDVNNVLYEYGDTPTVVGVKANMWNDANNWGEDGTDYVDNIEFKGTGETYNLNKDDRTEVDVTDTGFTMPPLPEEQFDFQITNEFAVDLEPDDYTITSEIVPETE